MFCKELSCGRLGGIAARFGLLGFGWGMEKFSDRLGQGSGRKGFLQERSGTFLMPRQDTDVVGVSRHEENSEIRVERNEMLCQLPAAHAGHDHVCQEQVQRSCLLRGQETGLDAVLGIDDLVPELSQFIVNQCTHAWVVLREQNRLASFVQLSVLLARCGGMSISGDTGKEDIEPSALADAAGDVNATA